MSDTGDKQGWWIDGVSVGSDPEPAPEGAPEPARAPAAPGGDLRHAPPEGIPAAAAPAQAAPAGTVPPPGPVAEEQPRRWPVVLLSLLVLAGIALIVFFVFLAGGAPSFKATPARHPNSVIPGAVFVGFGVKNTGSATGTPSCLVDVALSTGKVLGRERFTFKPLDPGKGSIEVESVKVTQTALHPYAQDAMDVQVTCT